MRGVFRSRRSPERLLVTMLFTDIVQSTERAASMGDRAWRDLLAAHDAAVRHELRRFGGREVDTTGDGFFATFDQPVQAVRAADAIVAAAARHGVAVRAGVHTGEAQIAGHNLAGLAVHITSRVMSTAGAGEVLVSSTVRDLTAGSDLKFEDRGSHALKGVPGEWHLFGLERGTLAGSAPEAQGSAAPSGDASSRPVLPLPERPSIAVLPFANLSEDSDQEYFADGIVEDIITGLSRIKWIFVIARNSSFAYKGAPIDVKQVGRELGVRYLLEGSVRKAKDRVRISAQLVDASTGAHIWADRYDREPGDIFAVQDELTTSVVGVIEPTLRRAEIERAKWKRPDSLDAYDLYLRALPFAFTAMPQDATQALGFLERAVELEPDYAAAHAIIAWCHEQRYLRAGLAEETRRLASRHARMAIAEGGDDAAALATAAFVLAVVDSDFDTAIDSFDRSFALSPSSALALGFSSIVRAWYGDLATAVEHAQRSIRLSPLDPLLYLPYIGLAYAQFAGGQFSDAAIAAGRASQSNPRFTMPHVLHAAALANLDRMEEALTEVERLLALDSGLTVASAVESARYVDRTKIDALAEALARAGLPNRVLSARFQGGQRGSPASGRR